MRSTDQLKALFEFAQSQGLPWIEVDGVKMPVPVKREAPPEKDEDSPQLDDDPCAGMSSEEILFYSTPYYDELKEIREKKENHAKEERELRKAHGQ